MSTSEFICPDCNKVCKTKASLKLHSKSHQDMHEKETQLNKVIAEDKKVITTTNDALKEVLSQLERLKLDTTNRIQEQIDRIQSLVK